MNCKNAFEAPVFVLPSDRIPPLTLHRISAISVHYFYSHIMSSVLASC